MFAALFLRDIELRVDLFSAIYWVRYSTAGGLVGSSVLYAILNCVWICLQHWFVSDIELRIDMIAAV